MFLPEITPPFVPAEAVKFQRWRVDGQKAWGSLEKMFNDISPQLLNTINFLLESAGDKGRKRMALFLRLGNLRDDIGRSIQSLF
jgi:hypothetical protein